MFTATTGSEASATLGDGAEVGILVILFNDCYY